MEIIKIIGIGLIAVITILILKQYKPEFAIYVSLIAGIAILFMALSQISGIVNLLKRDNVSKGVTVVVEDNHITIEFHIIVAYGVSIAAVTENLISNVRYKVEQFTGMKVDNICVYVEGVKNLD